MAKLFKGTDRKLLSKAFAAISAIVNRDTRADDPKPTQKLSTRTKMFPSATSIGSPPADAEALLAEMQSQLADRLDATA